MNNGSLNTIINVFKDNKSLLESAYKSDIKDNKKEFAFRKFEEITNYFQSINKQYYDFNNEKDILEPNIVVYYGDIYLTFYLCVQALLKKRSLKLFMDKYMVKTNTVIIDLFNSIFKEFDLKIIDYNFHYNYKDILNEANNSDNVFIIGNTYAYHELYSLNNKHFFPYYNLMIYCETDEKIEYKKLLEMVLYYSEKNNIEYEVINEKDEELIDYINQDMCANILLAITDNDEIKKIFEKEINGKKVFINSNPFKEYDNNLINYLKLINF